MEKNAPSHHEIYELLGGQQGLQALAETFYDLMDSLPEAGPIRAMHPENLEKTKENFTLFICGWLGGPPLYKEKFGSVDLTSIHSPFDIDTEKKDMWLQCMQKTLEKHSLDATVRDYLLKRFQAPASKIVEFCQQRPAGLAIMRP